ncbi:MAG TPA: helix-turn-helix domain-containing protein [Candidatus Methylomirabilis sp.]|nr:helix-turn-helix domain-containing protein [Candidatus Methylomirabilis sp.]
MLLKDLEAVGLTEKEAQIYLAALELGETNVNRLAEKSKIKRTTVYLAVDSLKQKGLISSVKKNKKVFIYAEDPRLIEGMLEERKNKLAKIMPELLSLDNLLDRKPGVKYYEGDEGIKNILNESLKYPGTEMLSMFSEEYATDFDESFFEDYYIPQRSKKRISVRAILPDIPKMRELVTRDEKSLRQSKLLPASIYNIKIEINIFGSNKVSIESFKEKFGLLIESQLIHDSFKNLFETIWHYAGNEGKKE